MDMSRKVHSFGSLVAVLSLHYVCLCMCACMPQKVFGNQEGNFLESVLYFYFVAPRDLYQAVRHGGKGLNLLSSTGLKLVLSRSNKEEICYN